MNTCIFDHSGALLLDSASADILSLRTSTPGTSSLFPLPSSLFPLPSSLFPLPSSIFFSFWSHRISATPYTASTSANQDSNGLTPNANLSPDPNPTNPNPTNPAPNSEKETSAADFSANGGGFDGHGAMSDDDDDDRDRVPLGGDGDEVDDDDEDARPSIFSQFAEAMKEGNGSAINGKGKRTKTTTEGGKGKGRDRPKKRIADMWAMLDPHEEVGPIKEPKKGILGRGKKR
jgi:hypothetical protein